MCDKFGGGGGLFKLNTSLIVYKHLVFVANIVYNFMEARAFRLCVSLTSVLLISLVPKPRPAFHCLQYGKAVKAQVPGMLIMLRGFPASRLKFHWPQRWHDIWDQGISIRNKSDS